jgi:vacuolar-type H+-ATPase subunit D/Vma8
MNPLTQIHVEELMDLLNNYLVEVSIQINMLERHSLENLNECNYNYIMSELEEFSRMIEGNDPTIMFIKIG